MDFVHKVPRSSGYRNVAQMVERSLRMREVGDRCPASPKHFRGFDKFIWFWLTIGKDWLRVTNRKLIYHEFCSEASSKLEEYGNVAEMAERSHCMREVRGSVPRISKTFGGFNNSMWCLLIMGRNWQLVTNRKLINHEFCSEASSKLDEYGNVAEMAERSLCMREVRGSVPRISKTLRLRQFYVVFADNGKELTTRYKSKADISWILFTRYLEAQRVQECSSNGRALASHARGRGSVPRISKTFSRLRQIYLVLADNRKGLTTRYKSKADLSWILFRSRSLKSTGT